MKRKATKQSRGPNAEEKRFQGFLKSMPCATGGAGITEVHHCKGSTFRHNKTLIGHWFCLPLSQSSHSAYHAGSKMWQHINGSQASIWFEAYSNYMASVDGAEGCPPEVYAAIQDLV